MVIFVEHAISVRSIKIVCFSTRFKLIRRFLFGTSPFLFPFGATPFFLLFGTTPFMVSAMGVRSFGAVGVSTHWHRTNEIPVVEYRGVKRLRAAGHIPLHLDQGIRNRPVYPLN